MYCGGWDGKKQDRKAKNEGKFSVGHPFRLEKLRINAYKLVEESTLFFQVVFVFFTA